MPQTIQTSSSLYRIRALDTEKVLNRRLLGKLHLDIFGLDCPKADFNHGYWWLAWYGKEVAGFAGMQSNFPETGYLCRSAVYKEHRGNGLQLRFIKAREIKARRLGWSRLRSDTTENVTSSNNLIRSGYKLINPEKTWAFKDSLYWEKLL